MEKRRPQLSLDELHQLKWLLGGGLVLLSVATVFYLDVDAWTLMALTAAGVLAVLVKPEWPARVPVIVHRLAFPAIVALFVGDLWRTGEILPAIVRLDILLLLYRGTSYRQKRDDLQVILLGLFLIVVAGVLTVSLVFAVQLVLFTAWALAFLLVITLTEAAAPPVPARAGDPSGPPAWTRIRWGNLATRVRAVTDWRVVALGTGLFALVVVISAALFLAIPRFQLENSLFLERFVSKKARSGFNETIRFGEVTEILQDDSVAANIDVTDRSQIPATPYWRMLVLDEYSNGTFKLSPRLRRATFDNERTGAFVRGSRRPRLGLPVWTFYLESGISRYLPLLGPFELLRFTTIQNYRAGQVAGLVALRDEPVTMTAYRVEGMLTGDTVPDPAFTEFLAKPRAAGPLQSVELLRMVGVGEADRAVLRQAVAEITGGATLTVADFSVRAERWLAARHSYSLQPAIPAGPGDPLVRWLKANGGGNCELFAGSFVLLARTAGYSTRVVTGFKGGTWNAYSSNFTLRNSDAHAWCEIFDPAAGAWRRVDPTVGPVGAQEEVRGEAALARRTDTSWSARFDSLRVFWYRRIVNFDQRAQVETLKAIKDATEDSGRKLRERLADLFRGVRDWLAQPWDVRRIARILAVAVAAAALGWGWREYVGPWWRFGRRPGRVGKADPVRREASRWLARFGPLSGRAADEEAVHAALLRLRFGARETWPEPEAVFRQARRVWRESRRRRRAAARLT
ncbi:MAG: DUF3488 domain-containing protein [Verrucomicrobia bacterium]|nr:DUF3488 domain-containing protein [Verrucomicrobiota bacterium]